MWDRLRRHLGVELQYMHRLLDEHKPLLLALAARPPDPIERSALAAMLHSFYNGAENLFKTVTVEFHEEIPKSQMWHRDLLVAMTEPRPTRPAVISASLRGTLEQYLDFRHKFRHAYAFQLEWPKMEPLVLKFEDTFRQLEFEVGAFLEHLK